jgi:hypothetical protein
MTEFKTVTIIRVAAALVLAAFLAVNGSAGVQEKAPLRAKIVFSKDDDRVYDLDNPKDAISMDLILKNVSGSEVWTHEGFDDQNFQSFLFIYGPLGKEGRLITSASGRIGGSPTPSVAPEKIAVEELNSKMPPEFEKSPWAKKIAIRDLRGYFKLRRPGKYKLWFAMSFVQYDPAKLEVVEGNKDDKQVRYYTHLKDTIWSGVIEFKEEYITLKTSTPIKKSDVRVLISDKILNSMSHGVAMKALPRPDDFVLRLYKRSAWEEIYGTLNSKTFQAIANDAQLKSEALVAKRADSAKGEFVFQDVAQDDCVIIGSSGREMGYRYLWAPIKAEDERWGKKEIYVKLQLFKNIAGIKGLRIK